jgi:threonylcarbamoyladenosine tRNA methylthiotransferase MtaB
MGRHWYTSASYTSRIETLARDIRSFALSADVIAGFPGETEEDHMATCAVVERLPFTSLHVFPYSERPGTAATRLGGFVPSADIRRRSRELREIGERKSAAHVTARAGGKCDVVAIERGKGLTEDYLSVAIWDESIARRSRFDAILIQDDGILTAHPNDAA